GGFDQSFVIRPQERRKRCAGQANHRALRPVDNFTSLYDEYLSKRNHLLTTMDSGEGNHGI
ncbi:hypothetical protein Q4S27_20950, partial [Morganella morganii subsp. sibonii]